MTVFGFCLVAYVITERERGRERWVGAAWYSLIRSPSLSTAARERTNSMHVPRKLGSSDGNMIGKHSLPQQHGRLIINYANCLKQMLASMLDSLSNLNR